MKYKICKMHFKAGIHIGVNSEHPSFMADTLFSALCCEAVHTDEGIDTLVGLVQNQKLAISDTMPYVDEILFVPKPYVKITNVESQGDSTEKKKFKKLSYIDVKKLDSFFAGKLNPDIEIEKMKEIGAYDSRTNVKISESKPSEPFQTETYHFSSSAGLYFCIGYEDENTMEYLEMLIKALSYVGIGGKRSRGLGRFSYEILDVPEVFLKKIEDTKAKHYTSLSLALPQNEELETACIDARYQIVKRSGFVASTEYADSYRKKKDFYGFAAGSTFLSKFQGDVFDVSGNMGKHPVYQYAVPFFMGVSI